MNCGSTPQEPLCQLSLQGSSFVGETRFVVDSLLVQNEECPVLVVMALFTFSLMEMGASQCNMVRNTSNKAVIVHLSCEASCSST